MKTSHPPIRRMIYIDQQIRERKYPNCNTIAKEFEVNRKTIQRDIEYLRYQLGAPIAYDSQRNGFYFTEPNYFLPAVHLQEKDVFAFVVAEKILKQYEDAPYFDELKKVVDKILHFLPDTISVEAMGQIFSFEQRPTSAVDRHKFDAIQNAALKRLQMNITYHSLYKNEITYRAVDPYRLMNHHGNWYLIAYCHSQNDIRMFALSRILSLEATKKKFKKPKNFSLEEYLGNSFDLEREGKTYNVELKFTPYQSQWIRERQWHRTQKIRELEHGSLILSMRIKGLNDLKRWVLKYGAEVEVLKPPELRNAIKSETQRLVKLYMDDNG